MANRRDADPSPWRTGIAHASMSLLAFGGLAASFGLGIHYSGNPAEAGPREVLALFETAQKNAPPLKSRLKSDQVSATLASAVVLSDDYDVETDEPSLGIEYADGAGVAAKPAGLSQGDEETPAVGIRINGKLIRPGESYGEVARVVSLDTTPVPELTERVNGLSLPRIAADGRAPSEVYARPFANPSNQPVIAIVVGGLGINATHTQSAIEELPAEVTLSFAPDASSLQYWINKARQAGHEVLIEVPMETFDYGRMKMHPQTLLAGDEGTENVPRLERLLSRASGYFGVINYQGGKFAEDPGAVGPVLQLLGDRGLSFIEDGSFQQSAFDAAATRTNLKYAHADTTFDAKLTSDDIRTELLELETLAKENGAAMGAGYAFPITIETTKDWIADLQDRGIVLAPVSAVASIRPIQKSTGKRMKTGSVTQSSLNSEG